LSAPDPPVITVDGQTQFCQGDSVALGITIIPGYNYNWKLNGGAIGSNSNILYAKSAGTYNIIVSNTAGCTVTSSNNVTIVTIPQPPPSTVNLSGPATFCTGGSITMSVSPTAGFTYSWKNDNGFIPDASENSYTATVSGNYQLRITNTAGCSIFTPPVKVSVNSLPVKPLIQADNYSEGGCLGETPIKLHVDQVISGYSYQWFRNGKIISGETRSYLEGFLQEGDYTVEADMNGCKAVSDGQNLTFEDAPEKPFVYAIGDNMWYLVCSDSTAEQYKWYYNDNLIQGATNYIYVANKKLGKYYVSIANEKGCFTFSDTITIPLGSTSLSDLDPFAGMKIYPNPTSGLITIEMENQLYGDLFLSVISGNGQEIIKKKFDKTTTRSTFSLDLSGRSKGIYFIKLKIDKFNEVRRLVLQ
jgi:hypothetical protein